jgi:probable phosphoglycerate mutase
MMVTRVFLVRHGATELSAEDRFAGSLDPELSEEGREQARRLGSRLEAEPLKAVYASPMRRTMETARLVAEGRSLEVIRRPELREIDHGRWEGKNRDEVKTAYPDEYSMWVRDPFTFAPTGGESGLKLLARCVPAFLEIVSQQQGERVLMVSHKATIRLLIGHLLGFELKSYRDRLDQSPCALNILDIQPKGEARLVLFNDVSHYDTVPNPTGRRLSPWWEG